MGGAQYVPYGQQSFGMEYPPNAGEYGMSQSDFIKEKEYAKETAGALLIGNFSI